MSPRYISVGHINIPLSQTAMPSKLQMNSYSAHPMNSGSKALCTGPWDISLENSQILTPLTKVSQKPVLCWTSNLFLQNIHKPIKRIPGTLPDHDEITLPKYNNQEDTVSTIARTMFNMRLQKEGLNEEIRGSFKDPYHQGKRETHPRIH